MPVGYEQNNIFLTDWNEKDIGDLDFYEVGYPDIPYPEVVDYTENQDGTITLIVNAANPNSNTFVAYSHRTVIRPLF